MLTHLLAHPAKAVLRAIRREMRLTPMKRVLGEVKRRGVRLKDLHAVEMFGASGESHVVDYASKVSSLSVWEINPRYRESLRQRFPNAEVKITDSYAEVKRTANRYSFIVIDNSLSIEGGRCEHFDLFPDIFRIAADPAILVLNVIPEITSAALRHYPYLFNADQLARRRSFYGTACPENISLHDLVMAYERVVTANGFKLQWHFFEKRNFVYYLVLKINRLSAIAAGC
jgi:hypothetical protein